MDSVQDLLRRSNSLLSDVIRDASLGRKIKRERLAEILTLLHSSDVLKVPTGNYMYNALALVFKASDYGLLSNFETDTLRAIFDGINQRAKAPTLDEIKEHVGHESKSEASMSTIAKNTQSQELVLQQKIKELQSGLSIHIPKIATLSNSLQESGQQLKSSNVRELSERARVLSGVLGTLKKHFDVLSAQHKIDHALVRDTEIIIKLLSDLSHILLHQEDAKYVAFVRAFKNTFELYLRKLMASGLLKAPSHQELSLA